MKFTFLTGDMDFSEYGGKWISTKQHHKVNGYDFAYVIDLTNMHEATGDEDGTKYVVTVEMIAPDEVPQNEKENAMSGYGFEETFDKLDWRMQIEVLSSYGTSAKLESFNGNNFDKLLREAKAYCKDLEPNDVLDDFCNAIGSTNRDFLRGDIMAGLQRYNDLKEVTKSVVARNEDNTAVSVDQGKLTSDCFWIQMFGPDRCKTCEYRDNHEECGGMEMRKKLKMV